MYLAPINRAGVTRYEIRQSYLHETDGSYRYRLIFDLGRDPARYLEQLSDEICYFSAELEECLGTMTDKDPTRLLEELLWAFLPEEEQHRLSLFRNRGTVKIRPLSDKDRAAIERDVHLFDRRRLYYLRYGAVDQSRIFRLNPKLYRPLLRQSRDEREYYFRDLEKVLKPAEMRTYAFAVFDLQRHFNQSFSATMPEALNQLDIADHFTRDICTLNQDTAFWSGCEMSNSLHDHLIRYIIMFFDHDYGRRSLLDDFVREFMGRHRSFRWPEKKPSVSIDRAARIFETSRQSLQKMNKKDLTRLFRQRAK
ncbi:MAG: hypothetical protein V2I35_08155, partial [Desulfocapsaceae bacterium]|nr:hypothetical protein [Desulfocapsaceae bacterium]